MASYYGTDASNTQVGGYSAYYMGEADDAAAGNAANESLYGGGGNDLLLGGTPTTVTGAGTPADPYKYVPTAGSGADYIEGGPGTDLIQGFDGNDVLYGGDGDDSGAFNFNATGTILKGGLY